MAQGSAAPPARTKACNLEALPVAIQHAQQRRIDEPVAHVTPFRLRETGDLHGQRKSESLERADGHRIEQPVVELYLNRF
jgi:hypothetical protein